MFEGRGSLTRKEKGLEGRSKPHRSSKSIYVRAGAMPDGQHTRLVCREHAPDLSCAETATLVWQALRTSFPGVTFSVRPIVESLDACIKVEWSDRPTQEEVRAVAKRLEGPFEISCA